MKCTDLQEDLDDYVDNTMSLAEQQAATAHITHCKPCQQALKQRRTIRHALRSLPIEQASPNFEEKVFAAVHNQYSTSTNHSGNRFFAGFATAMVASLALWFASTVYIPQFDGEAPQAIKAQIINLAVNQPRTVKIVFDAPTDLAEVTLRVEIPENIELEGYAGQKQLVWQTNLNKGQNILALPIIAIGDGKSELVAQLVYGDKTKQFRIVLQTAGDGALIHQINKFKTT